MFEQISGHHYQKGVDYVMQGYIIDGASFNNYSVKLYIRYLRKSKHFFLAVSSRTYDSKGASIPVIYRHDELIHRIRS